MSVLSFGSNWMNTQDSDIDITSAPSSSTDDTCNDTENNSNSDTTDINTSDINIITTTKKIKFIFK